MKDATLTDRLLALLSEPGHFAMAAFAGVAVVALVAIVLVVAIMGKYPMRVRTRKGDSETVVKLGEGAKPDPVPPMEGKPRET